MRLDFLNRLQIDRYVQQQINTYDITNPLDLTKRCSTVSGGNQQKCLCNVDGDRSAGHHFRRADPRGGCGARAEIYRKLRESPHPASVSS